MAEQPLVDQGAWAQDEDKLKAVVLTGKGSDIDLPEDLRFLIAVRRMVLAREREPDAEFDCPAAMVLVPAAFFEASPDGLVRRPFLNSGNYRLTGQVHYLGVAATGRSRDYAGDDGALLDALAADHADILPTVIYLPKAGGHSKLSWFPFGVAQDDKVQTLPVAPEPPTPERIRHVIDAVYEHELKSPDQVGASFSLWKDPAKGWAAKNAEERVQYAVRLGLSGRFSPQCRIKAEQPDKDGRTDIEIIGDFDVAPGKQTNFAVLEMKVLRERGSTGVLRSPAQIDQHVRDGLEQASTYGDDRHFEERMLCCFDMRPTNTGAAAVFAAIKDDAETLKVHLCLWYLYRASDDYRKAQVAGKLTGG
ncbi:MAG: hypothetical protein J0I71_03265 [Rhodanobacter sp.]|nr:hypothetical protein [Rhodanobacter sp.]